MAEINNGDMVRITAAFTNLAGVATDPTTITLTLKVDDVAQAPIVYPTGIVKDSVGNYHYDYITPAGTFTKIEYRWTGTGAVVAVQEGMFYATSRF